MKRQDSNHSGREEDDFMKKPKRSAESIVMMAESTDSPSPGTVPSDQMIDFKGEKNPSTERLRVEIKGPEAPPKLPGYQDEKVCMQHCAPLEVFCKTDHTLLCKHCATLQHQGHNKCYTVGAKVFQELDTMFLLEQTLDDVDKNKLICYLSQNYSECFDAPLVPCDVQDVSKLILERFGSEVALKIALKIMLEKGRHSETELKPDQCSALAYVLLTSEDVINEFDVKMCNTSLEGYQRLLPVVRNLRTAIVADVGILDEACETLALALHSENPHLRELDLSNNWIGDKGVKLLCGGLISPNSKVEKLRELDLSYNHPGEAGVRQLIAVQNDPRYKLQKFSMDHSDECRTKQGMKKYACEINLDPNTAHRTLILTEKKMVTMTKDTQPYPDHPDRFEYYAEVLCKETLIGARFYWEVEWTGDVVYIGVAYKGINRKGRSTDCKLGMNNKSWILSCSKDYGYYVSYNNIETVVPAPPNPSKRMGIYLDWNAGTLSYFIISAGRLYHTYTFHTTFTEPLYPAIRVYNYSDTVSLCKLI
ncbi:NACHT, LRR and PYD domains-containing protein 3-like isoform X1 [Tachysurus ichikawai]